jgi:ABC-type uncharacterized transport system fused permease/ATPase subunit
LNSKPKRAKNFDRRLWRRFWNIAKPYWFLDEKWTSRGFLLLLLLLGRTEFTVLFNQQSGEFTSALAALDVENEERLYAQLKSTSCTIVSVAHRSSLIKHHKHVLEVVGDGAWHLGQAKDYTSIE